jgi:hypothetical protein
LPRLGDLQRGLVAHDLGVYVELPLCQGQRRGTIEDLERSIRISVRPLDHGFVAQQRQLGANGPADAALQRLGAGEPPARP